MSVNGRKESHTEWVGSILLNSLRKIKMKKQRRRFHVKNAPKIKMPTLTSKRNPLIRWNINLIDKILRIKIQGRH